MKLIGPQSLVGTASHLQWLSHRNCFREWKVIATGVNTPTHFRYFFVFIRFVLDSPKRMSEFGVFAHASIFWNLNLNGVPVFSTDEMLIEVNGANQTGQFQLGPGSVSKTFTLQYGVPNTITVNIGATAAGASAVPEPATVVLLISGLGFMTGIVKKRRNRAD